MSLESIFSSHKAVVGIDEAGRGPLAGPVVAAAVILPTDMEYPDGLRDSKALSKKKRVLMYEWVVEHALAKGFGACEPGEIDDLNIHGATLLAMQRAVHAMSIKPDYALVDGKFVPRDLPCAGRAIIKGDSKVACISAASILAKVRRDRMMVDLDAQFPEYGFAQHSGYGTKAHMEALQHYGPCPHHRQSYAPVRQARVRGSVVQA